MSHPHPATQYKNPDMNGAKGKGYVTSVLNTDAGQSAFVRSCNLIGDLMPLYKSESLGIILQQLWEIMEDCPDLFPPDDPSLKALPTPEEQIAYARGVLANPALRSQMVALFYDDASAPAPATAPDTDTPPPPRHPCLLVYRWRPRLTRGHLVLAGATCCTQSCCGLWATWLQACRRTLRRLCSTAASCG